MTFEIIDADIAHCVKYLEKSQNKDPQIQNFLTRYLLVQINGEYEKEIKRIVSKRSLEPGDGELAAFINETVDKIRNFRLSDIKGILNKFDSRRGDLFESWTGDSEDASMYSNIITNRHWSAHGQTIQMTLEEVIYAHKKAKTIIKLFQSALYHHLS
ncbi:MAG TPA: HEPN domain-containing protein [Candidatus Nitrosotalea sp.]|nr:HEPN domain-containing protein [Candidatus Nitrosotalea sp.]